MTKKNPTWSYEYPLLKNYEFDLHKYYLSQLQKIKFQIINIEVVDF